MALTKIYRLIWDIDTRQLLLNPFNEYAGSTWVGDGRGFYETNTLEDVHAKMLEEQLSWTDPYVQPMA